MYGGNVLFNTSLNNPLFSSTNIIFGSNAGSSIVNGNNNVMFGVSAGQIIRNGNNNFGIGNPALYNLVDGNDNFAIGNYTLYKATGNGNVGMGNYTLYNLTTGNSNLAIGAGSMNATTTGGVNVGLGGSTLLSNVSGNYNVAIGSGAGYSSTGSNNIFLGLYAGRSVTSGNTNTFIGDYAGFDGTNQLVNPTNSTAIGNRSYTTASNQIALGNSSVTEIVVGRADNVKVKLGANQDASIYYDGTNLRINPKEVGSGALYVDGNVFAKGFYTFSQVYDDNKPALTKLKNSKDYLNANKSINYSNHYSNTKINTTDYSRPVTTKIKVVDCKKLGNPEYCVDTYEDVVTYPYSTQVNVLDLELRVATLEQAVYELKTALCSLDSKQEICK